MKIFGEQGHSGGSAGFVIGCMKGLAKKKFYVEPTENENNNIDVNINKTFHEKLGISPFMTNKKYITLTDYFIQDKLLIKRFKISC
jgi:hypothetical protein